MSVIYTINVSARLAPAIRNGANLTAAAVQTVLARDGLYRRIVAGTLDQDIRLRLSPTGAKDGTPLVLIREDVTDHTVTVQDWNGAVLTVMPAAQQWTLHAEFDGTEWKKISEAQHA